MVPSFVFIQNKKLLKEKFDGKLTMNELKREEIMMQAQVNEYIYNMLKNNVGAGV